MQKKLLKRKFYSKIAWIFALSTAIFTFFVVTLWQTVTAYSLNQSPPPTLPTLNVVDSPAPAFVGVELIVDRLPVSAEVASTSEPATDQMPKTVPVDGAEPTSLSVPSEPSVPINSDTGTGAPTRLSIPKLGLNAVIEQVGLAPDGAMAVPKDPLQAGWFAPGTVPGDIGSAVLAGHVDWWYGATGVFANLDKLKPGDVLSIENDLGQQFNFIVKDSKKFAPTANTAEIFSSTDAEAHLNLITCSGAWDKTAGQYSERLVVFTDLVTP